MTVQEILDQRIRWKAPARPFKRRNREYYTTIGSIVFLLTVILLFLKDWSLIAVMVSFAFVAYVLAAVPPEEVMHGITEKGIATGGRFYEWKRLTSFWFKEKWGQWMLMVEVKEGFPSQLGLVLAQVDREKLKSILNKHLKSAQPEENVVDRAASWLAGKIPLESE